MPDSEEFEPSDDEVTEHKKLVEALEDMSFYPKHDHFVGKSSSLMLLRTVMDMREEYQGSERQRIGLGPEPGGSAESKLLKERRPEFWIDHPVSTHPRLTMRVQTLNTTRLIGRVLVGRAERDQNSAPRLPRARPHRLARGYLLCRNQRLPAAFTPAHT